MPPPSLFSIKNSVPTSLAAKIPDDAVMVTDPVAAL
jgi:hypothetical protein